MQGTCEVQTSSCINHKMRTLPPAAPITSTIATTILQGKGSKAPPDHHISHYNHHTYHCNHRNIIAGQGQGQQGTP
jgi:hypothetical protein